MNWQAIGAAGEAVGAIAVVVTLVYLARQVRQARHEQRVAAIRANRDERREYFEAIRDSPYLPAIWCKVAAGEALTAEEDWRLLSHNSATWGLLYSEWVQAQLGLTGEYGTPIQTNIALVLLGVPRAREWLEEYGRRLYPRQFLADVERVEQELESS